MISQAAGLLLELERYDLVIELRLIDHDVNASIGFFNIFRSVVFLFDLTSLALITAAKSLATFSTVILSSARFSVSTAPGAAESLELSSAVTPSVAAAMPSSMWLRFAALRGVVVLGLSSKFIF